MPSSSTTLWSTLGAVVSGGISVLLDLALLVLALAVVRRRSPTGAVLMAAAAALMLVITVASPLAYAGMARLGTADSYVVAYAILNVTLSLVRAAGWAMLLAGIYKLATDATSR